MSITVGTARSETTSGPEAIGDSEVNTAIIDPSGSGDYLTLNAWAAANAASTDEWLLRCKAGLLTSANLNLATAVPNVPKLLIEPHDPSCGYSASISPVGRAYIGHNISSGNWAGQFVRIAGLLIAPIVSGFNSALLQLRAPTTILDRCVCDLNGTYAKASFAPLPSAPSYDVLIENCIFRFNAQAARVELSAQAGTVALKLRNCTIHNRHQYAQECAGIISVAGNETIEVTNCGLFTSTGPSIRVPTGPITLAVNGCASSDGVADDFGGVGNLVNQVAEDCFVDPANGDYMPKPGSPLIDAGQALPSVTVDLVGVSRPQGTAYDIGAIEKV